jgi:predicted metalloprotease with PDZ domain
MRKSLTILSLLTLLAAAPAWAGEGHKCTAGTQECLDMMANQLKHKGLVGVDGEWDDAAGAFKVETFLEGSGAEAAGVHLGDRLVAINGIPLADAEASKADAANRKPGAEASITVMRDGKKLDMEVTLIGLSDQQIAMYAGQHMLDHAVIAQAD